MCPRHPKPVLLAQNRDRDWKSPATSVTVRGQHPTPAPVCPGRAETAAPGATQGCVLRGAAKVGSQV